MFTGLIEETGTLVSLQNNGELSIKCNKILDDLALGDSVSVNGACLTVTKISGNTVSFHVSQTTNNITNFRSGYIKQGALLNLERAMGARARFGGHIVSGHIDGRVRIIAIDKRGADTFFEFMYQPEMRRYIVSKGSVTIDGISLTVASIGSSSFNITIIPATIASTNLSERRVGDYVHIETDILAKYVENMINYK